MYNNVAEKNRARDAVAPAGNIEKPLVKQRIPTGPPANRAAAAKRGGGPEFVVHGLFGIIARHVIWDMNLECHIKDMVFGI